VRGTVNEKALEKLSYRHHCSMFNTGILPILHGGDMTVFPKLFHSQFLSLLRRDDT